MQTYITLDSFEMFLGILVIESSVEEHSKEMALQK